ncbi:DUF692 domain-containing protein [Burkholderiaceae bacterium DAT-1]|nr:DUF692 domain-containing protein [Burkholderiaceae bacterium DAT-1]
MSPKEWLGAGLGLRLPHIRHVIAHRPEVAWFEVHPENYLAGGANLAALCAVREHYPIAFHGVNLGLGSPEPPAPEFLRQLKSLIRTIEPIVYSEHVAWNAMGGAYFNDLLPLPLTDAALARLCERIDAVQHELGRTLMIENVSSYVRFEADTWPEGDFLAELTRRTGCTLLLDVNNLLVTEHNIGRSPDATLAALTPEMIGEIHVAGYEAVESGLWVDTHGTPVSDACLDLLRRVLTQFGPKPVLLERDTHLPAFDELFADYQAIAQCCREVAHG